MGDQEAQSRGHKASRELEMTNAAFAGLRAAALDALVETGPEQVAKREKLYLTCSILKAVQRALQEAVDAGEVAGYTIRLAEQGLTKA